MLNAAKLITTSKKANGGGSSPNESESSNGDAAAYNKHGVSKRAEDVGEGAVHFNEVVQSGRFGVSKAHMATDAGDSQQRRLLGEENRRRKRWLKAD